MDELTEEFLEETVQDYGFDSIDELVNYLGMKEMSRLIYIFKEAVEEQWRTNAK